MRSSFITTLLQPEQEEVKPLNHFRNLVLDCLSSWWIYTGACNFCHRMGKVGIFKLNYWDTGCIREWKQKPRKIPTISNITSIQKKKNKNKTQLFDVHTENEEQMRNTKSSIGSLGKLRMTLRYSNMELPSQLVLPVQQTIYGRLKSDSYIQDTLS